MRHVPAQSRHDSGVCACLDESGLCLSILVYLLGLIFVFSSSLVSFFYFSMLLLLFFRSLVRLASLSSLFSLFGHVSPCSARWPVLRRVVLRRSACSPFGLAALFCVAWVGADASVSIMFFREFCIRASQSPRPLPLHVRGIEERFVSQSSTWLLVGKAGWLASGTRGRLICQLRQFGPPLCGPPYRRPPAESSHGSYERRALFRNSTLNK